MGAGDGANGSGGGGGGAGGHAHVHGEPRLPVSSSSPEDGSGGAGGPPAAASVSATVTTSVARQPSWLELEPSQMQREGSASKWLGGAAKPGARGGGVVRAAAGALMYAPTDVLPGSSTNHPPSLSLSLSLSYTHARTQVCGRSW
jgi:hypothetical protein